MCSTSEGCQPLRTIANCCGRARQRRGPAACEKQPPSTPEALDLSTIGTAADLLASGIHRMDSHAAEIKSCATDHDSDPPDHSRNIFETMTTTRAQRTRGRFDPCRAAGQTSPSRAKNSSCFVLHSFTPHSEFDFRKAGDWCSHHGFPSTPQETSKALLVSGTRQRCSQSYV